MRRLNLPVVALATGALLALPSLAQAATSIGIVGSPHDFSGEAWNTRRGTCTPCHQAHHTDDQQIVPLWAHATATGPYITYQSPSLDATGGGALGQPTGVSLACLSCHDGTVAINQGITQLIGTPAEYIDPSNQIGPDLHTTHPISFRYDAALATTDGGLEDPTSYTIGSPKTGLTDTTPPIPGTGWSGSSLTGKTIDEALLFNHRMECGSCHDVHKMEGSAPSSGILLRISGQDANNRGSLMCRNCHIK